MLLPLSFLWSSQLFSIAPGILYTANMKRKNKMKSTSHVQLFVTPWTVACQAPLSMWFSRQEYWSGLPFPSPGDLSNPRIKPRSPALQAYSLPSEPPGKSKEDWGCYQNDMHLIVQIQHLGFVRPTFKELLLLSMYHDDHLLDCIFWGYI